MLVLSILFVAGILLSLVAAVVGQPGGIFGLGTVALLALATAAHWLIPALHHGSLVCQLGASTLGFLTLGIWSALHR